MVMKRTITFAFQLSKQGYIRRGRSAVRDTKIGSDCTPAARNVVVSSRPLAGSILSGSALSMIGFPNKASIWH